ncbi:sugar phosphate isomerase/epimerase family protein [Isosphaeraceae bacterium EP7]
MKRRSWLASSSALFTGAGLAAPAASRARLVEDAEPFGYSLNTSTISGQKLPITQVVDIAAKAGYRGIEPWVRELDQHVADGGSLKDLGTRIADAGLSVEGAIGFFDWGVDDEARRGKAMDEARRNMDLVRQIGGKRLAAPPAGLVDVAGVDLLKLAERYRALLVLGDEMDVVPQLEIWGFSKTLGRLGEAALVAIEASHPKACILPDVYHLHRGGSGFGSIPMLSGSDFHVFHVNDFPATPEASKLDDSHRVYPGDGVAPLTSLLRNLRSIGFRGMLSLELFNRELWKQDPLVVARTGLEKIKAAVQTSLAP